MTKTINKDMQTKTILNPHFCFQSCHPLDGVKHKEVSIDSCLNNAGGDSDDVIEALIVVSVDPVEDVEQLVQSQSHEVEQDDRLHSLGVVGDRELGDDGDSFQVHRECPEYLHHDKLMVEEESEDSCPDDDDLNPDGVQIAANGSLVLDKYQEYIGEGTEDEEDLDRSVVQGDEICEDIQVAGDENNQEQDL